MQFRRQQVDVTKVPETIRYKWPDEEVLTEGVASLPKMMLRCLDRIFGDTPEIERLQVMLTLVDYRYEKARKVALVDYLAYLSGLTKERFKLRLLELKQMGVLDYQEYNNGIRFKVDKLMSRIYLAAHTPRPMKEAPTNSSEPGESPAIKKRSEPPKL